MKKIKAIKGTKDILPGDIDKWTLIESLVIREERDFLRRQFIKEKK